MSESPRLLRIHAGAAALWPLMVLGPALGSAFVGSWLPYGVAAMHQGGLHAVSDVSFFAPSLTQVPDGPRLLPWIQLLLMGASTICIFPMAQRWWRRCVVAWGLATTQEVEAVEKHAK